MAETRSGLSQPAAGSVACSGPAPGQPCADTTQVRQSGDVGSLALQHPQVWSASCSRALEFGLGALSQFDDVVVEVDVPGAVRGFTGLRAFQWPLASTTLASRAPVAVTFFCPMKPTSRVTSELELEERLRA